jgi:hypothetical protein
MNEKYEKVDDFTLKQILTEVVETDRIYDYDYLVRQRQAIADQKDKELFAIDELISQCKSLGVSSKEEKIAADIATEALANPAPIDPAPVEEVNP